MMRRNKYNAIKVKPEDHTFDSKGEYGRFCELQILERARTISKLTVHPKYTLRVGDNAICRFVPDFEYEEEEKWIVEDFKSTPTLTPTTRIKMILSRQSRDPLRVAQPNAVARRDLTEYLIGLGLQDRAMPL